MAVAEDVLDLVRLAEERDFSTLEDAWERALGGAATLEVQPFLDAAEALAVQAEGARATALLSLLSEALAEADRPAEAFAAIRATVDVSPRPSDLRDEVAARARAAYADRRGFESYLKLSRLEDGTRTVEQALKALDDFLDFPVGRFVFHAAGWGTGKVVGVDPRTGALEIDFARKEGHRLPIEGAVQFLERLPSESLLARAYDDLDGLKALAKDHPADLIRLAVRSRGGSANIPQLKKDLIDVVISKGDWTKMWGRARRELTHDPHVELGKGPRAEVAIREEAVRFADEVLSDMERASDFAAVYEGGRRLLKEISADTARVTPEERAKVRAALEARLNRVAETLRAERPGLAIAGIYLLADLAAGVEGAGAAPEAGEAGEGEEAGASPADIADHVPDALDGLVTELDRFFEAIATAPDAPTVRRYIRDLRRGAEGWAQTFAAALPSTEKEPFQLIARALRDDAPELCAQALTEVVSSSDPKAGALTELARETFAGRFDDVTGAPSFRIVLERLIAFSDRQERLRSGGHPGAPAMRARLKQLLGTKRHDVVRRYFREAPLGRARHTYARIMASPAVDDEVREAARSVVARERTEMLQRPESFPWEDPAILLTSRQGLRALERDLEHVVNVRIPENREAIGRAAAFGDLSENAEYTAALEERDQLVSRADRLRKELERATLIEDVGVEPGVVGPGTRVALLDRETGKRESYTLLGPWDTDLDNQVISYTAPLAKGLLGRRVGDEAAIELPGGDKRSFTVEGIEIAI